MTLSAMQPIATLRSLIAPYLLDASLPEDEVRRRLFISVAGTLAIPLLSLFALLEVQSGSLIVAGFMAGSAVLMVINVWLARRPVFTLVAPRIGLAICCLLIAVETYHHASPYNLLWAMVIPLAAVFVFGRKEGLVWSLGLGLLVVAMLLNAPSPQLYALSNAAFDFSWAYAVVTGFALGYETLQLRAREVATQRATDLIAERRRFQDFAEVASNWLFELDQDLRFVFVSESWAESMGLPADFLIGVPVTAIRQNLTEDGSQHVSELAERMMERKPFRDIRFSIRVGKREYHVSANGNPMFDDADEFAGYRGTARDVTEIENSERLIRVKDTELLHSQKMEAIGQLTSGVAHDFNNLLTVINGNLELLTFTLQDNGIETTRADAAMIAANRAAELTSKLLAFARRQALAPEAIDVSQLAGDLDDLLRRTLGEPVSTTLDVADDLWLCHVDRGQLENAILNLAINARDAMPDGGELITCARNQSLSESTRVGGMPAGDYVVISVTDTGTGIPAEQLPHVFEPFFSTKPQGQGSGLGLSMVYGFVNQSGGHSLITSTPGKGTTVTIYLPRYTGAIKPKIRETPSDIDIGTKKILLVEDETDVRELVAGMLESQGHQVRCTEDGEHAVGELDDWQPDILVTDVVLGGSMSGISLAETMQARIPDIKVLLISGYPEYALGRDGALESNLPLLKKPFGSATLQSATQKLFS